MRISVVTITYNAAGALRRTLDSVEGQTYPDIEHLIVDGASTDNTLSLALRYRSESRHEVVVRSEPDDGLYDAMNKGLRLATGDYLLFLNAGDTLYAPDTIETVVRHAAEAAHRRVDGGLPAVVYGDTAITDADGRFLRMRRLRPPLHLTWRSFRQGMLVCHQAFYVRTDIARETPYNLTYRYSADVDWCIRVMKEAERRGLAMVHTQAVLCNFEDGGSTTRHHWASLAERFRVMAIHYGVVQTAALHLWFVIRALKIENLLH